MRTLLLPFCAVIGTIACTPPPAEPATPIEVVVDAKPKPSPVVLTEDREARPESVEIVPSGDPVPELPEAWTSPAVDGKTWSELFGKAQATRAAYTRLPPPPQAIDDPKTKEWFGKAVVLVDQTSRIYAAAYHAPDAPPRSRVSSLSYAAQTELRLAMQLDDLGIVSMPPAWRTDPALRVSFEEVAFGPMKRWRDDARALAHECVRLATETKDQSDEAKKCTEIERGAPHPRAAKTQGCGCAPGDPLCSASLGGWCR